MRKYQLQEADLLQDEVPDDHGKNSSEEVTQGTLEGDIVPGDITFYRLQSTADNKLRAYIAQGEVLPVATDPSELSEFSLSRNGTFLSSRTDREELPSSRCCCFRTLRQGSVRSIQVHRRTCRGSEFQSAEGNAVSYRESLGQ